MKITPEDQINSSDLSIVVYRKEAAPQFYSFTSFTLKTFLYIIPTIIALLTITLVASSWWIWRLSHPEDIIGLTPEQKEIIQLKEENQDLLIANQTITQKLSEKSTQESDVYLGPLKIPFGMKNKTNQNLISIDQMQFNFKDDIPSVSFSLSNNSSSKVTGYIHILLHSASGIHLYPTNAQKVEEGINFNQGESFSVSRLRPVNAKFYKVDPQVKTIKFTIIIFNREGDLLKISESTQYPLKENNS